MSMKYISTRPVSHEFGYDKKKEFSFIDVILTGLAPGGGLFIPKVVPQLELVHLREWSTLSYADLAANVISLFSDDIPFSDIKAICKKTYTSEVFANVNGDESPYDIVPVVRCGKENGIPFYILALSNGPTLAFKDLAMQFLGNLLQYILERKGQNLTIIGATSGDTGSAAAAALRGKKGLKLFMLSPYGRMSSFQRAQMFSINDKCVANLSIDGVFDDCQDIVKSLSNDQIFKKEYSVGAVNSINWGRIVAQVVYYIKAYCFLFNQGLLDCDQNIRSITELPKVSFSVPSGNFGDAYAGYLSKKMGLPIDQILVATNENDVLHEFFKTGKYKPRQASETKATSSPSMDISKASNLERLLFDLFEQDTMLFDSVLKKSDVSGFIDIKEYMSFDKLSQLGFVSGSSHHSDRIKTISFVNSRYNRLIDPHTADAFHVALNYSESRSPMIVLETAQPCKFASTVQEAIGKTIQSPSAFSDIEKLPQHFFRLPASAEAVKKFIIDYCIKTKN